MVLAKVRLAGVTDTVGTPTAPVPVKVMVCSAGRVVESMVMVAVRDPITLGVKVTVKVQLLPAFRVPPQPLVKL